MNMNGAKGYRITVTAIIERTETVGKEWTTVAHEPIGDGSGKTKPILNYTPEIEKVVTKEVQVFEQRVDELDMAALVLVVNGIDKTV
jgi:hypothetical protein